MFFQRLRAERLVQLKKFASAVYHHLNVIRIQRYYRRARAIAVAKARMDAVLFIQVYNKFPGKNCDLVVKKILLSWFIFTVMPLSGMGSHYKCFAHILPNIEQRDSQLYRLLFKPIIVV